MSDNRDASIDVRTAVARALQAGQPVVALESTLIAQGLPWPLNLETARAAEEAVRAAGGVPATIAVWRGRPTVGLSDPEIEELSRSRDVLKASRRDLAYSVSAGRTAATTVAATMYLAHRAGIRVFATGGIGGVHRHTPLDVSADLIELARTPVAVVCAGAKNILDLPATFELLETLGVPVIGFGTDEFPAFYVRTSGEPVSARVDRAAAAAALLKAHWQLDGAGIVLAQPVAAETALAAEEFAAALAVAERDAANGGVRGKELTPFLLRRLAEITAGRTLQVNKTLIVDNARLAAEIATQL